MENNNKSQAEIYREERKERLAKAASKKAKKSPALSKAKRIIGKVIAVVLAVVIVFGAIGGVLNFFGTPQKAIKVSVKGDKDFSFSLAEFNFYYYLIWNQIENSAYQYEYQYSQYYGEGAGLTITGYDYTKSPALQEYKEDVSGNFTGVTLSDLGVQSATWADVMKYAAISQLIQTKYGAKMASDSGLTLTEDQKSEIDKQIQQYADDAKSQDYSTNRYLRQLFGNGITEKLIREVLTEQTLSSSYFEKFAADSENSVTKEQIDEKYTSARDSYDVVSLRTYSFTAEYDEKADDAAKEKARSKAKTDAESFLANAVSEPKFIELASNELKKDKDTQDKDANEVTAMKNVYKSSITSNICEDAANWAFNADTKTGDSKLFAASDDNFVVVMLTVAPHKDTTSSGNDVRHILFKFPETQKDDDGKEIPLTDAQKAATRAEAEKVLELYKANPTEENFINLTKEHTDDVDTEGNPNNGGLYEGIIASSNYVEGFLDWAIDESRKTGDVDIVETTFGYHIMYYVKSQGETWEHTIIDEIVATASNDLIDKIDTDYISTVNMNNMFLKWAFNQQTKHINQIILKITSSNTSN